MAFNNYSFSNCAQWYQTALPRASVAARFDPDGRALFDGILPAIGIHTGVCTDIRFHRCERQIIYKGAVAEVADTLSLNAAPGQVNAPALALFVCICIRF